MTTRPVFLNAEGVDLFEPILPPRSLTVVIDGRPPTPNARPGNRFAAFRLVDEWRETAHLAAQAAMLDDAPLGTGGYWPLEFVRAELPAGGRRKKAKPALYRCSTPILFAVAYEMVFVVPDLRERDWDNAVASSKPLTDGLVAAGVLAGDSTRYIDPDGRRVTFRHEAGASRVVIRVVEGPDPASLGLTL